MSWTHHRKGKLLCVDGNDKLVNSEEASVRATLSETAQFSSQRRPPHNDRVLEL